MDLQPPALLVAAQLLDERELIAFAGAVEKGDRVGGTVPQQVVDHRAQWRYAGAPGDEQQPLFVRVRGDAKEVAHTGQDAYNSDSFICVPLIYNNRLCGVMNLSNKKNGEPFEDYDLDRAQIAGSLMAVALADLDKTRRASACPPSNIFGELPPRRARPLSPRPTRQARARRRHAIACWASCSDWL